jgi:hypothetical protein
MSSHMVIFFPENVFVNLLDKNKVNFNSKRFDLIFISKKMIHLIKNRVISAFNQSKIVNIKVSCFKIKIIESKFFNIPKSSQFKF